MRGGGCIETNEYRSLKTSMFPFRSLSLRGIVSFPLPHDTAREISSDTLVVVSGWFWGAWSCNHPFHFPHNTENKW